MISQVIMVLKELILQNTKIPCFTRQYHIKAPRLPGIETLALSPDFDLPPVLLREHLIQEYRMGKFTKTAPEMEDGAKAFEDGAGIYAEFRKIICISGGYFYKEEGVKLKIL